jgi:hypothetical protein
MLNEIFLHFKNTLSGNIDPALKSRHKNTDFHSLKILVTGKISRRTTSDITPVQLNITLHNNFKIFMLSITTSFQT